MVSVPDNRYRERVKNELAAEVVRSFREVPFKLVGSSMLPALRPGDDVVVRGASMAELRAGDVVQYLRGGRLVTHRFLTHGAGHAAGHAITQGDSVARPDAPVSEAELVGRVVSVRRGGRSVDPRFTARRKMAAWALRRSELLTRVAMRVARVRNGRGA